MRVDWCIHYNGIWNEKCDKGHVYLDVARPPNEEEIKWHNENYSDFSLTNSAIGERIPCTQNNKDCTCPNFRLPTRAEIDEDKVQTDSFIKQIVKHYSIVRPVIEADIQNHDAKGTSFRGEIPCPICETGQVSYGYAGSVNGHIHAQCTTQDCVQWVE